MRYWPPFEKQTVYELNSKSFEYLKSQVQNLKLDKIMREYCDRMVYNEVDEDRCISGLQNIVGKVG